MNRESFRPSYTMNGPCQFYDDVLKSLIHFSGFQWLTVWLFLGNSLRVRLLGRETLSAWRP